MGITTMDKKTTIGSDRKGEIDGKRLTVKDKKPDKSVEN